MTKRALDALARMLRPAGGGLHLVSTGRAEQLALQQRLYRACSEHEVEARFAERLHRIAEAKVIVLGVPSDVGAGFRRGASLGPGALRDAWIARDPGALERDGVVDVGDVRVVPQLLHDEMLTDAQITATRRALYDGASVDLPVSPLSITERVLDLVLAINPRAKPLVLGGDHSIAWPVTAALHRARRDFAIVQSDAHTDLLEERLGVRYCFATWSFHANELLGRGGRLTQVGIRASRHDRAHWESSLGVRQLWARECNDDPRRAIDVVLDHVRALHGVRGVYFSNDIDGTDERYADATGTPEPGGLDPAFLVTLIRRLGEEVGLVAGDLVEVAPEVACASGSLARTLETSVRYLEATLDALLA